jgi:cytochrome c553
MRGTRALWAAAAVTAAAIGMASATAVTARGAAQPQKEDAVKRGNYLVLTAGCHDCHTPMKMGPQGPEPDMSLALSGHPASMKLPPPPAPSGPWFASIAATMTAWAGPWGLSYTANLTPDKETGLGNYTEAQFIQTIRDGKKQGRGRPLLPPMPWPMYRNASDEDLRAIFAYVQSLRPVRNRVPLPVEPQAQ